MKRAIISRLRTLLSSTWFRFLLSASLLTAVLVQIDFAQTLQVLHDIRVDLALAVLAVGLAGRAYAALRWYLLLHGKNPEVTFWRTLKLTFVSTFAGFLLPGTVGVEATRIYGLSKTTSDVALALASVMVERVFAAAALIALALVALAMSPPGLPPELSQAAWFGIIVLAAGTAAIMTRRVRRLTVLVVSAARLSPVRDRLVRFYDCLDAYSKQPQLLIWSFVAAAISPTFRIVPVIIGAWALGIDISVTYIVIFVPIIVFAAQLPISIGGLGVREIGFVSLFGLVGVPAEIAVALSLLLYAAAVIGSLPGAWFYVREGMSPKPRSKLFVRS